jgi:hypothetical protein
MSVISYLRGHVRLSSLVAGLVALACVSLASGLIGGDTLPYHLVGYLGALLNTLYFKASTAVSPAA